MQQFVWGCRSSWNTYYTYTIYHSWCGLRDTYPFMNNMHTVLVFLSHSNHIDSAISVYSLFYPLVAFSYLFSCNLFYNFVIVPSDTLFASCLFSPVFRVEDFESIYRQPSRWFKMLIQYKRSTSLRKYTSSWIKINHILSITNIDSSRCLCIIPYLLLLDDRFHTAYIFVCECVCCVLYYIFRHSLSSLLWVSKKCTSTRLLFCTRIRIIYASICELKKQIELKEKSNSIDQSRIHRIKTFQCSLKSR